MKLQFSQNNRLIPAIIQDAATNKVLMLGFMNKAAYQKTRKTKRVTFYSRSKKRLWTKGETSGNFLEVISINADCDKDALLIKVKPRGATCHTGAESCFDEETKNSISFLESLLVLIKKRARDMPKSSYTASLFRAGLSKIGAKVTEEAQEVVKAAQSEGRARVTEETSDLLYHLLVLIAYAGLNWGDIEKCLMRRRR